MKTVCLGLLIIFSALSLPAPALELFGIPVITAQRDQIRKAIRENGAQIIREAGNQNFYDIYDSRTVLQPSRRLYVGYDKQTGRFAFAEYELPYAYLDIMLLRLRTKYSEPEKVDTLFASDQKFVWRLEGAVIYLFRDWNANVTRLIYSQPEALASLQKTHNELQAGKQLETFDLSNPAF